MTPWQIGQSSITCTRDGCGRTVTVEAARAAVEATGRLPACACERTSDRALYAREYRRRERPRRYDDAQRHAYRRATTLLREHHPEEFNALYEESKQFVGLDQHRAGGQAS